jgi:hypothetical protein
VYRYVADAPLLAFVQDDDAPRNGTRWLAEAAALFAAKPALGLLGGKTGRVDPRGAVGLCTLNSFDPYPITYSLSNP